MTGWRVGWIAGSASLVKTLGQLKTNIDSGIFQAVQWAAIEALRGGEGDTLAANDQSLSGLILHLANTMDDFN